MGFSPLAQSRISPKANIYKEVLEAARDKFTREISFQSKDKNISLAKCFFPQYVAQAIKTPLFILNSAIDSWQIRNILAPGNADPRGLWSKCKFDITKCSAAELRRIQGYRAEFIIALSRLGALPSRGYFINSCFAHCQTEQQIYWFGNNTPKLNNKTIARAIGDWFYDRSPFQKIDCRWLSS